MKFLLVLCLVFYLFFSSRSSTNAVDLTADGNSDCKVDGLDYVLWLNNYGIETNSGKSGGITVISKAIKTLTVSTMSFG